MSLLYTTGEHGFHVVDTSENSQDVSQRIKTVLEPLLLNGAQAA